MRGAAAVALLWGLSPCALAGGPLRVNADGSPMRWNLDERILDASAPGLVPYRVDPGALGSLPPAAAQSLADRIFITYAKIPTARLAFENRGPTLSPSPPLLPGTYHMALTNASPGPIAFTIRATIGGGGIRPASAAIGRAGGAPSLIPLSSGVPAAGEIAGGLGGVNQSVDPQFTLEVPEGATSLRVVVDAGFGAVDLFLRRGQPVALEEGGLVFDHASQAPGGQETFELLATRAPVDVNVTNVGSHIGTAPTGQNEIIFDEDGTIHALLFGANNGVLGFFQNRPPDARGFFTEGYVVLNGRWIDGNTGNGELPVSAFRGIFTHEFGHFVGLDHAQVNGDIAAGAAGALDVPALSRVEEIDLFMPFTETLYPFLITTFAFDSRLSQQALHYSGLFTVDLSLDDRIAVSMLYPRASFLTGPGSTTGSLEGRVLRADGLTPMSGANAVLRRLGSTLGSSVFPPPLGTESYPGTQVPLNSEGLPLPPPEAAATDAIATAVSQVAGAFGPGFAPAGPPVIGSGRFQWEGLPPGEYRLDIESVLTNAVGGSRIGPFNPQLPLAREEAWSGSRESGLERFALPLNAGIGNGSFEQSNLDAYTAASGGSDEVATLRVEAGERTTGVEIILEAPSPEGDVRRIGALGTTAPITPREGNAQLLVTNGSGFAGSIAQRFDPGEARAMAFDFNFLTNEQTPDPGFNDRAIVTSEVPPGAIDAAILADTGSSLSPVNPSTGFLRATGYQTFVLGDLDLIPPGEAPALRWSVVDGNDVGVTSGLLLDHLRLLGSEPEGAVSILPGLMSFDRWTYQSVPGWTAARPEASTRDGLALASDVESADTVGMWLSPPDLLPWQPDSVFRVRFHLRSEEADPSCLPLVRLRLFSANSQAWFAARLEPVASSAVAPTPQGRVAEVWFDPPDMSADQGDELHDDILAVFELDDFSAAQGAAVHLDRVEVDRFPRSALDAVAVTLRSHTVFDTGEVIVLPGLEDVGLASPRIELHPGRAVFESGDAAPAGFLGFYREVAGAEAVDVSAGDLIRVRFRLGSDTDPGLLPPLRPRVVFGDMQFNVSLDIISRGGGAAPHAHAPGPAGRDYWLYLRVPEASDVPSTVAWAVGMMDFSDALAGAAWLNRVDIQRVDGI